MASSRRRKTANGKKNKVALRVKRFLRDTYGNSVRQVILYGSYARGAANPDSDLDLLVVVDDSLKPFEVRKALDDMIFELLVEEHELVSVIVLPESFFKNYNSPFVLNVKDEGISL